VMEAKINSAENVVPIIPWMARYVSQFHKNLKILLAVKDIIMIIVLYSVNVNINFFR
jgi:hypothetical protein